MCMNHTDIYNKTCLQRPLRSRHNYYFQNEFAVLVCLFGINKNTLAYVHMCSWATQTITVKPVYRDPQDNTK